MSMPRERCASSPEERGRIASADAIRVRGYALPIDHSPSPGSLRDPASPRWGEVKRKRALALHSQPALPIHSKTFKSVVQRPQPLRVTGYRLARIGAGRPGLVAVTHHHIGTHQPEPSLDIVAVLLQAACQPIDHAT